MVLRNSITDPNVLAVLSSQGTLCPAWRVRQVGREDVIPMPLRLLTESMASVPASSVSVVLSAQLPPGGRGEATVPAMLLDMTA